MRELDIELPYTSMAKLFNSRKGMGKMKDKKIWIIIVVLILAIITVISVLTFRSKNNKIEENRNVPSHVKEQQIEEENPYIMEEQTEEYSVRTLEADTKDSVRLFIETNIWDEEKTIEIHFNNTKYILNTAQPMLKDALVRENGDDSYFDLKVSGLENYGIVFIKKDISLIPEKQDIKVSIK